MDNILSQARDLIAQGQLSKSLALLRQQAGIPPEANTEIIIFQARLSQLERAEMLFGDNQQSERNRLNKNVLDFVGNLGNTSIPPISDVINQFARMRRNSLQQKIKDVYALMEQWEQKLSLSENPTETKKCEIEILRLQGILDGHLGEWHKLGGK